MKDYRPEWCHASDRDVALESALTVGGFALMAGLVIAALFGAFGKGGPNVTVSSSTGDLSVTFDRRVRRRNETWMEVRARRPNGASPVRVTFDQSYFDRVRLLKVSPQPAAVESDGNRITFVLDGRGAAPVVRARLYVEPQEAGWQKTWVAADDGAPVSIRQFVFP